MSLFWKLEREIGLQEALECFQKAVNSGKEELEHCQEIGLVAIMFFFELLFLYVSLEISLYVSLANLFSIILFLICRLPETHKTKEKQDSILLVQETV